MSIPFFFLSSHPQLLLLNITSCVMEYAFGHFRSAVLAVSCPHFLPTFSLLAFSELERDLMLYKHFSAIAKTLVHYQPF